MATLENDWVRLSDDSGSGDTPVTATVKEANTGRNPRSVVLKGTTAHDAEATATITQAAKSEFVQFTQSHYYMDNGDTSVTITGRSNSRRLTFVLGTNETGTTVFLNLPQTFTVEIRDGVTVVATNMQDIGGDPGLTSDYEFSVTLTTRNTNPQTTRRQFLYVTGFAGSMDTTDITQAGITTTILFDGYQTGMVYDLTNIPVGGAQTIHVGVTPAGEDWTLEFEE